MSLADYSLLQKHDKLISSITERSIDCSEGNGTARKIQLKQNSPHQALGNDTFGVYAVRHISDEHVLFSDEPTTSVAGFVKDRCALYSTTIIIERYLERPNAQAIRPPSTSRCAWTDRAESGLHSICAAEPQVLV